MKIKEQINKKMKQLSAERERIMKDDSITEKEQSLAIIFGKLLAMEWVTGIKYDKFFK